jgi:HPt (histidine-containing phosphotransfer) domain-containing protein
MEQPNLSYVNQLSSGDIAFKNKLIGIIKAEFPEEKAVYFKSFNSKNYRLSAENVHKLKHKISILGLEKSYKLAEEFEDHLKEGRTNGYDTFHEILQMITDYLETL